MNPSRQILTASTACAGFTLTEMLVSVAVAAILAAMAAPSFNALTESQRAKSVATDVSIALMRARAEALKRSTNMTLSPKNGDWTNGWEMLDPISSTVIEDHDAPRGVTVSGPSGVTFQSSGRVQGATAPSFSITGSLSASARCVAVDLSGRPRTKAGSC